MPNCAKHRNLPYKDKCPYCADGWLAVSGNFATKKLAERAIFLLAHPESINQDAFGVCGMTSVLYVLLKWWPARFDELFLATFGRFFDRHDTVFTVAKGNRKVPIDVSALVDYYENYATAYVQDSDLPDKKFFVDYFLSRALGQLLKGVNKAVYDEQKAVFNQQFGGAPWLKAGNLALESHAIVEIFSSIVGVTAIDTDDDITEADMDTIVEGTKDLSKPGEFAFAAIFADLVKTSKITTASKGDGKKAYNHWVVIDGPVKASGSDLVIPIWTWGKRYTVTVAKNVAHTYIREIVSGHLKMA